MARAFTTKRTIAWDAIARSVETHFGLQLDPDSLRDRSVADLAGSLAGQLGAADDGEPLASGALGELRSFFDVAANLPKERIAADTPLVELLPNPGRRKRIWSELRAEFGACIPPLEYPWWATAAGVLAGAGCFVAVVCLLPPFLAAHWELLGRWLSPGAVIMVTYGLAVGGAVATLGAVRWLTGAAFRTRLPRGHAVIGDLVPDLVAGPTELVGAPVEGPLSRELVAHRLYRIVSLHCGVPVPVLAARPEAMRL